MAENSAAIGVLMDFGRTACNRIISRKKAPAAVNGDHFCGHGGTHDGIVGAAAAVGQTLSGWSGRSIEFNDLRQFQTETSVGSLEAVEIQVLCGDRNALVPGTDDRVDTRDWVRPRLWGFKFELPVRRTGPGRWRSLGGRHIQE